MKKTILLLAVLLLSTSVFCQINNYRMKYVCIYENNSDGVPGDIITERDDIGTTVSMNLNKNTITIYLTEGPEVFVVTNSSKSGMFKDSDGDTYQVFTYESMDDEGIMCTISVFTWQSSGYNIHQFWIKYSNVTLFYQGEFINRIEK